MEVPHEATDFQQRAETYQPGEINGIADCFEKPLRDNKPPSEFLATLLLHDLSHDALEVIHIAVFIPLDVTSRDL